MRVDKFLHEIPDRFPRRWHPKGVRTLVDCVHHDVDWVNNVRECLPQALYQHIIGGLPSAVVMSHEFRVEYVAGKVGASGNLGKGRKE